ncbi:formate dehydrogenase gamma subunit [Tamilnaduibacter salinus]|uniref:NADH-quinone oxidoreductase subunit E n=1 Tax=Tamilnaduibacter salinus TaxID=1484056 RepID=A0A2U1D0J1_9GAMM|nr:formate dehydrogenase subunit gamma [Tamilnaduibacter salinus]PVY78894.1 formate dehydrogenase gamma subunit [Tamilnaduibacter salinus]
MTDLEAITRRAIDDWVDEPGALLPILHAIQDQLGYIPPSSVPRIARALNMTRADVHGVMSFYHEFRSEPAGRHVLQICGAEACQARGCRELEAHTQQRLGVGYHQTTLDGDITLEQVYCLGNCATGPSVRLDDRIIGRVTPQRMDRLLDGIATVPLTIQPAGGEG